MNSFFFQNTICPPPPISIQPPSISEKMSWLHYYVTPTPNSVLSGGKQCKKKANPTDTKIERDRCHQGFALCGFGNFPLLLGGVVASASHPVAIVFGEEGNHALTTPEIHGTNNGADGWEFLYDSEYLSLKFSLGFSACFSKIGGKRKNIRLIQTPMKI